MQSHGPERRLPIITVCDVQESLLAGELFDRCESVVERMLLQLLLMDYCASNIFPQFKVGPYRMDFVTADGVGWEVDGKQYHDADYDNDRDTWILNNSFVVRQIIRIPAAVLKYYTDACLAVMSVFVEHIKSGRGCCYYDYKRVIENANGCLESIHEYGADVEEIRSEFQDGEAFDVIGNVGFVGSPFAFLPYDHGLRKFEDQDRICLNRWRGRITSRVRGER